MKLTTKLLLGVTVVAGFSISTFAACATDVDFGGTKKITGLADGVATGEAVHYGQAIERQVADAINVDSNVTMDRQIRFVKSGGICTTEGQYHFNNALPHGAVIFVAPDGFKPLGGDHYVSGTVLCGNTEETHRVFMKSTGEVQAYETEAGGSYCTFNLAYNCN